VYPGIYILQGNSIFIFTPLALNLIFGTINYFMAAFKDPGFINRSDLSAIQFHENDNVKDLYGNKKRQSINIESIILNSG